MRRSDISRPFRPSKRTTQIIFGERQHLRAVLVSLQNFQSKYLGWERERTLLHRLIDARTTELNQINRNWDDKFNRARNLETPAGELEDLVRSSPEDDYLLLRTITEHPHAPTQALAALAGHPYDAVRENVARHPNADGATLSALARLADEHVWLLVAAHPSAPEELRAGLRRRLAASAASAAD